MISFTGDKGQARVRGSQESLGGREQETSGIKSIGTELGMENSLRLENSFSANSSMFVLLFLKNSKKHRACFEGWIDKET